LDVEVFQAGQLYFRVTYPDRAMLFPGIESFVCLGRDLLSGDRDGVWYFQPARDFALHGNAFDGDMRPVVRVSASEADDMLDVEQLTHVLGEIQRRLLAASSR
jgi:hypothetical protein